MAKPVLRTLRELRVERGLTLPQLQTQTGINKGTLSQIERGRIVANDTELAAISHALDTPLLVNHLVPCLAVTGP